MRAHGVRRAGGVQLCLQRRVAWHAATGRVVRFSGVPACTLCGARNSAAADRALRVGSCGSVTAAATARCCCRIGCSLFSSLSCPVVDAVALYF